MVFYSFDTSSIMNGRRDLLPPTVFRTLWSHIELMIAEGTYARSMLSKMS